MTVEEIVMFKGLFEMFLCLVLPWGLVGWLYCIKMVQEMTNDVADGLLLSGQDLFEWWKGCKRGTKDGSPVNDKQKGSEAQLPVGHSGSADYGDVET